MYIYIHIHIYEYIQIYIYMCALLWGFDGCNWWTIAVVLCPFWNILMEFSFIKKIIFFDQLKKLNIFLKCLFSICIYHGNFYCIISTLKVVLTHMQCQSNALCISHEPKMHCVGMWKPLVLPLIFWILCWSKFSGIQLCAVLLEVIHSWFTALLQNMDFYYTTLLFSIASSWCWWEKE